MKQEFFSQFFSAFSCCSKPTQLNIILLSYQTTGSYVYRQLFSVILVSESQNRFLPVAFILRKKQPFPLVTACPLEKCKILISLRKIIIIFIIIIIKQTPPPPKSQS